MQITRKTYEEFFLLYNDGELSTEEKKAVEDFIVENPDLADELLLLQETIFAPDENMIFDSKEVLFREERKTVPFPWFRIAAAAALLISFSIIGWLYLGEKATPVYEPLASKEFVRQLQEGDNIKKVAPAVVTVSEEYNAPSENLGDQIDATQKRLVSTGSYKRVSAPPMKKVTNEKTPLTVEVNDRQPDPSSIDHAIIHESSDEEGIDIIVAARDLTEKDIDPVTQETTFHYAEEKPDDMIYFANTSLPKKSKLRGVFRKATRILDKVTSLQ